MLHHAVLLAAGLGNRLRPYTDATPKCLVPAGGLPILGHMIRALQSTGFRQLTIVTGYEAEQIQNWTHTYLRNHRIELTVSFVHSPDFATTNNIVSLWQLIPHVQEGFVLLESDLIFEPSALMAMRKPDRIALDAYNATIHSGTTALCDGGGRVTNLFVRESPPSDMNLMKTVNITSFSQHTWSLLSRRIDKLVCAGITDTFYEWAIRDMIRSGEGIFQMTDFRQFWWDEIDTVSDLGRVNSYLSATQPVGVISVKTDNETDNAASQTDFVSMPGLPIRDSLNKRRTPMRVTTTR